MTITIEATYEDGVLRPARPLPLAEHEKVRVTVEQQLPIADNAGAGLATKQANSCGHSAFLNSYAPEDEGLYDDCAAG